MKKKIKILIKIHKRNKNKFIIYKKNSITLFKVLFININI